MEVLRELPDSDFSVASADLFLHAVRNACEDLHATPVSIMFAWMKTAAVEFYLYDNDAAVELMHTWIKQAQTDDDSFDGEAFDIENALLQRLEQGFRNRSGAQ